MQSKKLLYWIGFILLMLLVSVVAIEIVVRQIPLFRYGVDVIHNPDHRMRPFQERGINSDGIRSKVEAVDVNDKDFNVIVLGDSFMYGVRLGNQETVPHRLEELLRARYPQARIHVINFGWIGSGPLLHYRLLRDIGQKYKPDLILHMIDMTDVGDDLMYNALIEKQRLYKVGDYLPLTVLLTQLFVQRGVQSDVLSQGLFGLPSQHYFIVEKPLEQTRYAFDFHRDVLKKINHHAREELGVPYAAFIFPRYFQYNPKKECPNNWEKGWYSVPGPYSMEPFRYYEEMRTAVNFPVISLLPEFQHTKVFPTVWKDDAHFSAAGAQLAAEAIFEHCQQQRCFDVLDKAH